MPGTLEQRGIKVRKSESRTAHFVPSIPCELLERLWEQPEELVNSGRLLQEKYIRRTVRLRWDSQTYVLKHYIEPTWQHAVKHSFQPSRAWKTWSATHKLADAGIATPRPVACIEKRRGKLWTGSFMMYPYVEGQTLSSYLETDSLAHWPHGVWQQLSALWQRLAEIRVTLVDTNVRNFILSPQGQVWVIDLDRTRFHRTWLTAAHYRRRAWARLMRTAKRAQLKAA